MEQYIVKGGNSLVGEVEISGAKNAALAILAASIMTDDTVTIENVPGAALPSTGRPGTRIFTVFGTVLTAGAGVLLWKRREIL